jgi:regulator of nonsense transcripts 3
MSQSNGVPPTVLQRVPPNNAPRGTPRKPTPPRLKVLIRRLPPGLTETEFYAIIGAEWKTGAGKADWANYEPGKISKE